MVRSFPAGACWVSRFRVCFSRFAFYMENGGWFFWKTNAALAGG